MTKKKHQILENNIDNAEVILWQGHASKRALFFYPSLLRNILGFIWLIIAVVWTVLSYHRPVLCACIAVPLFLLALFFLGCFFANLYEHDNTRYVITSKRIIVAYFKLPCEIYSRELKDVVNPTSLIRNSGFGDVYFFADIPEYRKHSDFYLHYLRYPAHTKRLNGFFAVENAKGVYDILLDAISKAQGL